MGVKISICEFLKDLLSQETMMGNGVSSIENTVTLKGHLQKLVLENVIAPILDFLTIDQPPILDQPRKEEQKLSPESERADKKFIFKI